MASNNGFNALFSVEFESYSKVKQKLDNLTKAINSDTKINLQIDSAAITKTIQDLSKLTKQNITIMDNGQIKTVSQFNDELGRTIKLKQDIVKGTTDVNISQDFEKQAKEEQKFVEKMADLREKSEIKKREEIKKTQQAQADAINKNIELEQKQKRADKEQMYKGMFDTLDKRDNDYSKMFDELEANEKKLTEQMAKGREQAEIKKRNEINKTAKIQADAINKNIELEQKQRIKDSIDTKKARDLVALEKEKLNLKLKGVEADRKGLIDKDGSSLLGNKISNLSGNSTEEVRRKVQLLNLELAKLDQQAKLKGLQVGQTNISSLGSALQSTAMKLGIFATSAAVLQELTRVVRDSYEYVRYLDKSYTDLNITMDISKEQFTKTTLEVQRMGREMGASSRAIMDVARVYSNASTNINDVLKRVEPTMWLSNVSRMDSQQVTKVVQSTINQFKLMREEGANVVDVTERVGNSLVSISKNMEFDFGQGIYELTEAVQTAGSVAEVSGQSMESFMSMIGAAIVQSGKSGSEIASAYKMISARVLQQKQLAEAEGITEEEMAKAEKTLKQYNISIREGNGNLKGLDTILLDLSKSWGIMSDSEKQYVANTMAGVRQSSTFVSIMESMGEQQRLYNSAIGDTNSLQEAQEKYANSLEGKLGSLSATYEGLLSQILNSSSVLSGVDFATGLLSGVSTVIDKIGLLPTVLGGATIAYTLFNQKARDNMMLFANSITPIGNLNTSLSNTITRLNGSIQALTRDIALRKEFIVYSRQQGLSTMHLNAELMKQQIQLVLTTAKMIAAKVATVALQTAMSMGLSLAITGVVTVLSKLGSELFGTGAKMEDCSSQARALSDSLNSINDEKVLVGKYGDLKRQLEDTNLSEQKRKDLNEQLADVKGKLASSESDYAWILNDESLTLDEQLSKMQQMYELNLKNKAIDLDDNMISKSKANTMGLDLNNNIGEYNEIKQALANLNSEGEGFYNNSWVGADKLKEKLGELEGKIKDTSLQLEMYNGNVKLMEKAGYDSGRQLINFSAQQKAVINDINKSTEEIKENTEAKKENDKAMQGGYAQTKEISVADATKDYGKAVTAAAEFKDMLKEINKEQELTPEMVAKLADKYPELGAGITNIATTQEFLNSKVQEQLSIQSEMYQIMVGNDEAYYQQRLQNAGELQGYFNGLASEFVDVNGEAYTFDVNNFKTLNAAKIGFNQNLSKAMADFIVGFVGGNAEAYEVELRNFKSLAESKAYILQQLNEEVKKIQQNMASIAKEIDNGNDDLNLEKRYARQQDRLNNLNNGIKEINTSFDTMNKGFESSSPTFGGGGSGSSGSSSSKKDVADLDLKIEKYQYLTDMIEDMNNALDKNSLLQEKANGKDKQRLISEEIALLKRKQELLNKLNNELRKESSGLKNSLSKQGATFDADGNINNYEKLLTSKQNWANSLSGDAKEQAIAQVKALEESIKRYREITQKELNANSEEWYKLNNAIKDAREEQAKIIADTEKQISSALEKELNDRFKKKKEALDKEKELYNKQNKEEDYSDELNSKNRDLLDIQAEMDRLANATDRESKLRLQQLMKDYEAKQKEINDFIKDNQRDEIDQRFEDEQNMLDKELEDQLKPANLNKLIQEGMSTGFITLGNEVIKLDDLMTDYIKNSTIGITNQDLAVKELNDSFAQTKAILGDIGVIYSSLGLGGTINYPKVELPQQGRNIVSNNGRSVGEIKIINEVKIDNGADLNAIRRELDKRDKNIISTIANQLTNH